MSSSTIVTARDLSSNSGAALDASQRGPVVITKQGRPFSVLVSYHDIELQLSLIAVQKEIARRKEEVLFGAQSNALEGNSLTKDELSGLLGMIDEGLDTDGMVSRIMADNGWPHEK